MIDPVTLEIARAGGSLCVRFERRGDRFEHTMEWRGDEGDIVLLTAVDGAHQAWPASPPWQELHVHDERGEAILMLVGRAGSSHWSMSVTRDEAAAIVFDTACRVREAPQFLGTTYRLGRTDFLVRSTDRAQFWTDLEVRPTLVLRIEAVPVDEHVPATIDHVDDRIIIRAATETSLPATVRWKYRIAPVGDE